MMRSCDLLLSDCYASVVPEFKDMQEYINEKCIHSKYSEDN